MGFQLAFPVDIFQIKAGWERNAFFFLLFFLEVYELFQVKCFEGSVVLQLKASDMLPKGLTDLEVNLWGPDSDLMILLSHQFLWEASALT